MPTTIQLARRWGQNPAGSTVDVDDEQAQWLVNNSYGHVKGDQPAPRYAAAPGQDGPDPTVSSVPPRPVALRGERGQVGPVVGSPPQYRHIETGKPRADRAARAAGSRPVAQGEAPAPDGQAGNDKDPATSKAAGSKRKTSDS